MRLSLKNVKVPVLVKVASSSREWFVDHLSQDCIDFVRGTHPGEFFYSFHTIFSSRLLHEEFH